MPTRETDDVSRGADAVALRDVQDADLDVFFEQERDPQARRMAAFTGEDPNDRAAHDAHWARLRSDPTVLARTITLNGGAIGNIAKFERDGAPEVTYWLGREHWGRGLATASLAAFLKLYTARPLYGGAAADNAASIRVLEKCGFVLVERKRGFAAARGEEIDEVVLKLAD